MRSDRDAQVSLVRSTAFLLTLTAFLIGTLVFGLELMAIHGRAEIRLAVDLRAQSFEFETRPLFGVSSADISARWLRRSCGRVSENHRPRSLNRRSTSRETRTDVPDSPVVDLP